MKRKRETNKNDATLKKSKTHDIDETNDWLKSGEQFQARLKNLFENKHEQNTDQILLCLALRTENDFIRAAALAAQSGTILFDRESAHGKKLLHEWAIGIGAKQWSNAAREKMTWDEFWEVFLNNGVEKYVNELSSAHGLGPLHYCCSWGSVRAAEKLLSLTETNANLPAHLSFYTPLMYAVTNIDRKHVLRMIYYLLAHHHSKFDFGLQNAYGFTVHDMIIALPDTSRNHKDLKLRWMEFRKILDSRYHEGMDSFLQIPELVSIVLSYLY